MSELNKLSNEELSEEINRLRKSIKSKRFGLVWKDIPEAFDVISENKIPVLKEVPKFAIDASEGSRTHIIIEGDNYHTLTCLNYTHKQKIDLIYIDPPYNTGSTGPDGFRYKDKRISDKYPDGTPVPLDHPFRHSYWISFMKKRLELAKNLIKETGFLVVSIDDNELFNLKLLCDLIMGPENFISCIPTIMNLKGNQDEFGFAGTHEYTLIYAKNKSKCEVGQFEIDDEELDNWLEDDHGFFKKADTLRRTGQDAPRTRRPKGWFPVFIDIDKSLVYVTDDDKPRSKKDFVLMPINDDGEELSWSWSKRKITDEPHNLIITGSSGKYNVYKKQRPRLGDLPTKKPKSIFYKAEYSSSTSTNQLKKMFGRKVFDNPKPLKLIEDLIELLSPTDGLVLDFFAGSGTTGHAVLSLNSRGGNRQFMLATNNEGNIMHEVCYPRIKMVVNGYNDVPAVSENVKYYSTAFIGNNPIYSTDDYDAVALANNVGELLALAENTLIQTSQTDYYQVFTNGERVTAIYFREELQFYQEFIDIVNTQALPTAVYVFSWGEAPTADDFINNKDISVKSIPRPILEIYRSIYNLEIS